MAATQQQAPLLSQPRWAPAAQALVDGCTDLHDDEDRVALMAAVCEGLGDELYPAFLRVLWTIGQHGDHAACATIARTLVHALRTGRLPSGRRSAWGDSAPTGIRARRQRKYPVLGLSRPYWPQSDRACRGSGA